MVWWRAPIASVVLLMALADGAQAAECTGKASQGVSATPDPVRISGAIGGTGSLSGLVRITLPSGVPAALQASDLKGPRTVPAARIGVGDPLPASGSDLPVTRRITLDGITDPGDYTGTITVVTPDDQCTIGVDASVMAQPQLAVLGDDEKTATVRVTQRGNQTLSLPLRNASPGSVRIEKAALLLREKDLRRSPVGITALPPLASVPPGAIALVPLEVTGALKPGDYAGALQLEADDATTRPAIPVSIKVKKPLWWALLLIALGCLARVVVQVAARGRTLAGPARKLTKLRRRAKALDPAYRDALTPLLDRLSQTIYLDRDLAEASELSPKIDDLQKSLARAHIAGETIPSGHKPDGWQRLQQELLEAVEDVDDEHARQVVARLEVAAKEAGARPDKGMKLRIPSGVELSFGVTDRVPRTAGVTIDETRAALGWISIFLLPALVEILMIAVLAFLGLKELYLANDTFGADVVLDDVGLVVWTIGANAAGKVLGTLTPTR